MGPEKNHSENSKTGEPEKCKIHLKRKHKKCKKKHKKTKHAKKCKYSDEQGDVSKKTIESQKTTESYGPQIPEDLLLKSQSMAPMSKQEWEERNKNIRKVFDEETGRTRLIRGDGEIIEEIVSHKRHMEINKQATIKDGAFFQSKLSSQN